MTRLTQHIINCDSMPRFAPFVRGLKSHKKGGEIIFDSSKIKLYNPICIESSKIVSIESVLKKVKYSKNPAVLNANVLDYLLDNQEIIPDSWSDSWSDEIFFFGTVYRFTSGEPCIRTLQRCFGNWRSQDKLLRFAWQGNYSVAMLHNY